MKKKVYESNGVFIFFFICTMLILIAFCINIYLSKYPTFLVSQGVVKKDELIVLIVKNSDTKYFYSNNYLYYKDNKYKYKIVSVVKDVLKRDGYSYNEIVLSFSFKKLKENDAINISIVKDKEKGFNIFRIIWEK